MRDKHRGRPVRTPALYPANPPPPPGPAGLNAGVGPITRSALQAKDRDALLTERLLDPYNWQGVLRE